LLLQRSQELENSPQIPQKNQKKGQIKQQTIPREEHKSTQHLKPIYEEKLRQPKTKLPPL